MWSSVDQQYYAMTEQGECSPCILKKDDQVKKQYKAQLIIKQDGRLVPTSEGVLESTYCFLRTTQELTPYYTGPIFRNLEKHERSLIPILLFDEQISKIRNTMRYRSKQEEAVIAVDNENNVYCIKHVYQEGEDNSKKVSVYDTQRFRTIQVPVLSKKESLLKIHTLEEKVSRLQNDKKVAVNIFNTCLSYGKKFGMISFVCCCAALAYKYNLLSLKWDNV